MRSILVPALPQILIFITLLVLNVHSDTHPVLSCPVRGVRVMEFCDGGGLGLGIWGTDGLIYVCSKTERTDVQDKHTTPISPVAPLASPPPAPAQAQAHRFSPSPRPLLATLAPFFHPYQYHALSLSPSFSLSPSPSLSLSHTYQQATPSPWHITPLNQQDPRTTEDSSS